MVALGNPTTLISVADLDDVANFHSVTWNVHQVAVNKNVAVGDDLAGLIDRIRPAHSVNNRLKSHLKQPKEVQAAVAVHALSLLKRAAELLFEHAVMAADNLLRQKLLAVFRCALVFALRAMLTHRVRSLGARAFCLAPDVKADFAANVCLSSSVGRHNFRWSSLTRG